MDRNHEFLPGLRVVRQRQGRRRRAELCAQVLPRRRSASGPAARLPHRQRRRRLRELPAPGRGPSGALAPGRSGAASRAAPGRARLCPVPPGGDLRAGHGTCRDWGRGLRSPGARAPVRLPVRARAAGRRRRGARPLRHLGRLLGRRLLPPQQPGGLRGLRRARPLPGVSQRAGRRPLRGLPDRVHRPRRLPQFCVPFLRSPCRLQHVRVDESEEERPEKK